MRVICLTACVIFVSYQVKSQSYLHSDVGNMILLRPNLGYEYQWQNKSLNGLIMWKRNDGVWAAEIPEIMPSNGIRTDFSYRFFGKNYPSNYLEFFSRFQYIQTDSVFYYDPSYDANRTKKGFEFGPRAGTRKYSKSGRLGYDFCIGLGYGFYKISDQIINPIILTNENYNEAVQRTQQIADRNNKNWRKYAMPYAQFRIYFKLLNSNSSDKHKR